MLEILVACGFCGPFSNSFDDGPDTSLREFDEGIVLAQVILLLVLV